MCKQDECEFGCKISLIAYLVSGGFFSIRPESNLMPSMTCLLISFVRELQLAATMLSGVLVDLMYSSSPRSNAQTGQGCEFGYKISLIAYLVSSGFFSI
jgi:hypothetical protein